ncbi:SpoIIE family protein phosphatase [Calditerrivibrio nitroreducens]|nr:SpoIIE family protein phosphatase [Calditerrivibrio nitroreducens]
MMMLNEDILKTLLTDNKIDFVNCIEEYLHNLNIKKYIIWDISKSIATVNVSTVNDQSLLLFADISDIGYFYQACSDFSQPINLTENTRIYQTFFLEHNDTLLMAVSICEPTNLKCKDLYEIIPYLSSKLYDIIASENRTEIFIEYQKKIDFIKNAYDILKFLEFETIFSKALDFFIQIFDAQAGFLQYNDTFLSIGVEKLDSQENIHINGTPLYDIVCNIHATEFFDSSIDSSKFLINNIFIIHEEKYKIKVVLFNISTNFYPDKEFSEIISHITSIAVENAINHQKELQLKLEENEMKATAEILNSFVDREVSLESDFCTAYGVSYPAKQAGGDFLGLYNTDEKIIVCIGDVCGKGYSAAVITVLMSTMFQFFTKLQAPRPSSFALYLSSFLMQKNLDGRFVTLFIGVIDKKEHKMEYISLGHEPVFIYDGGDVKRLVSDYMPAGIIVEKYKDSTIEIKKGYSLFIYSDGLVEYTNYDDLEKKVLMCNTDAEDFIKNLYNELVIDKNHQMDDFTCIKIDIKG